MRRQSTKGRIITTAEYSPQNHGVWAPHKTLQSKGPLLLLNRRMDKEDRIPIYDGILLSCKKEQNWIICRDVDVSRWSQRKSQSEREKQIPYINISIYVEYKNGIIVLFAKQK